MAGHDLGEEGGVQVRQGLCSVLRGLDPILRTSVLKLFWLQVKGIQCKNLKSKERFIGLGSKEEMNAVKEDQR